MTFLWPIVVLGSIAGWGSAAGWLVHRLFGLSLFSLVDRLVLGLIVVVFAVGVALMAGVPAPLMAIVVAGVALGLVVGLHQLRAVPHDDRVHLAKAGAIGAAAIGVVAIYTASTSLRFVWNACDDHNYLYLARRLILEGDLADPGNLRRIQSPGGMSALQALYLDQLSARFLPFADRFLGSTLLLTGLWRTRAGRWSPWGIAAAAIAIVAFPMFTGLHSNTSPVLIPAALTLVTVKYLIDMRTDDDRHAAVGYGVLFGFIVATGLTLRPQIGQSLALLIALLVVWPPSRQLLWRRGSGIVVGGLLGLLPWAIASWRDAATPLFPLLPGNTDPAFPVLADRLVPLTAAELGTRLAGALVDPLWLATLGVGLVALFDAKRRRPDQRYAQVAFEVFLGGLLTCAIWLVAMTITGWNFGPPSSIAITRYFAPLFLGLALAPLLIFNHAPQRLDARARTWSYALLVATAAMALISSGPPTSVLEAAHDISTGTLVSGLENDRFADQRPDYATALAALPPDVKVFSAVDLTDNLLGTGRTIHTLDVVGAASVPPHLPYFTGDGAKTQWLRDHGYDYLVAMAPATSTCLYNDDVYVAAANDPARAGRGRPWEPYVRDWSDYVGRLETTPGARRFGPLVVVPIG